MTEKTWLTADRLLEDSYRLANKVIDAGFAPTHIVGIWRGGAPVGIAVQELLAYNGIEADHIAIRTASYSGIDQQDKEVRVYALGYLIDTLNPEDRLLVIDDVFDTGRSIEAFLRELELRCRHNMLGRCGSPRPITSRAATRPRCGPISMSMRRRTGWSSRTKSAASARTRSVRTSRVRN